MLQSTQSSADATQVTYRDSEVMPPPDGNSFADTFNFVKGLVQRQYTLVIYTTATSLLLGALYLVVTPPTYTAHARLLLGNPNVPFVQQLSLGAERSLDRTLIETELQILRSRNIIASAIQQSKLADNDELKRSDRTLFKRWFGKTSSDDKKEEFPLEDMIEVFQKSLSATRIDASNVIDIGFSWTSAPKAAEIANAIANAYIDDQLKARFEANKTAMLWLQQRLHALGEQAESAERAVNTYKSKNNIVTSTEGKSIDEQKISELNSRLAAARAQTTEATVRLDRYESALKHSPETLDSIGKMDAAGSDLLVSPIITALRQQYFDTQRRENEYAIRFGKDHQSVINLLNRMREIRKSIQEEVRRLAETTRNDQEIAKQRQNEIEKQLAEAVALSRSTNAAGVTLRELQTKAKEYRNLYDTFLQRYMGSTQQQSFPISEARLIYAASPPLHKSKPKTLIVFALSFFGGIAFGSGLAFLRNLTDRVFRTPTQLEDNLGRPCFAVIPHLAQSPNYQLSSITSQASLEQDLKTLSKTSSPHWTVANMPLSRFAESIRSVKLGIDLSRSHSCNKVIGITSTQPGEGKSTIAAGLAQLIGQSGQSVILVDCDLRNPALSRALAPNATIGVINVISGMQPIESAVWTDAETNLVFMPAVTDCTLLHSSAMLSADPMHLLVEKLCATYDYVIIDLPPLAPIVDARASSAMVDCFIHVVEWGQTKIDVVKHALHTAPNVYEKVIGTVLNKTDIKEMASYNGSRSDYYNESHYAHYGVSDRPSCSPS
jgi:exopolysaccharide transport family protein